MSAVIRSAFAPTEQPQEVKVALLGLGTVGSAVLERLHQWQEQEFKHPFRIVHVANSRHAAPVATDACPLTVAQQVRTGDGGDSIRILHGSTAITTADLDDVERNLGASGPRIVVDATASDVVASRQAQWLERGIHVVTACKLGQGTSLQRFQELQRAREQGATQYGDSATVGAGLPVIRSIKELREGGDRITRIAGVLSGSLAWLFNQYDGMRPFSGWVREAGAKGYTEPDPRDDLSGEDVRRKILILARNAGVALESDAVQVHSLVPESLQNLSANEALEQLDALDAPLKAAFANAYRQGEVLRHLAVLEKNEQGQWHAQVGLQSLPPSHPLAGGAGTDNRVAIWSDRYCEQPLVIQGPGAGAQVTAAGLLDDALRLAKLSA